MVEFVANTQWSCHDLLCSRASLDLPWTDIPARLNHSRDIKSIESSYPWNYELRDIHWRTTQPKNSQSTISYPELSNNSSTKIHISTHILNWNEQMISCFPINALRIFVDRNAYPICRYYNLYDAGSKNKSLNVISRAIDSFAIKSSLNSGVKTIEFRNTMNHWGFCSNWYLIFPANVTLRS